MEIKTKFKQLITVLLDNIRERRKVILALSCLVVFFTTYLLILPAFTLDKEEASKQGGIDLHTTTADQTATDFDNIQEDSQQEDITSENTSEPESNNSSSSVPKSSKSIETVPEKVDDPLKYENDDYSISIVDNNGVLPDGTTLSVEEIDKEENEKDYKKYYNEALSSIQDEENGENVRNLSFAHFYDISLKSGKKVVEPKEGESVNVKIEYDKDFRKELGIDDTDNVKIIHFTEDEETGKLTAEILDTKENNVVIDADKKDQLKSAEFDAESFSVYAVVYTVDFSIEVNGVKYGFTLNGGDAISLAELSEVLKLADAYNTTNSEDNPSEVVKTDADEVSNENIKVSQDTKDFIGQIENVEFSNPDYLWVGKIDNDVITSNLISKYKLTQEFPYGTTDAEYRAVMTKQFSAPDWVLISLKPFSSQETLTITMKDGETIVIGITDDADAILIPDGQGGQKVQTISNPNGTTMDLIDYWISDNLRYSQNMSGWPGHTGQPGDYSFDIYTNNGDRYYGQDYWDNGHIRHGYLRGNGNNQGINNGHIFKFYPGCEGTVIDGTRTSWGTSMNNRDGSSTINSWTGDADPTVGLIQSSLSGGYPVLRGDSNLGTTNNTSLAYLFDNTQRSGKQKYSGVNNLLYVDSDGYYTYDSRYYSADYSNGNFTVRKFSDQIPADDKRRGFWPFGDRVNWHGMHMTTEFSMPANGQVLNPKGEYKDMQFEFSGDDDTWLFVDGILVGDGGGIHNRTEIDINFATGQVTVTGKKDTIHQGSYESVQYLDDIFRNALREQGKSQAEINQYIADKFDGHTFKQGSKHTFEMFYLERGGSESNLYIHYNLVSTTDFSAHKSYHTENPDNSRLTRDQFQFELIGFDNPAYGAGFVEAIMPDGSANGDGTVASPKKTHSNDAPEGLDIPEELNLNAHTSLITGVTEDGNVNFGNVQIQESQLGKVYYYAVREIVPDDAINADGVRWDQATSEQKAEGGFAKDGLTYDDKVYYFKGAVVESEDSPGTYELKKTRYTDSSYSEVDNQTKFFSFVNGYVKPLTLKVVKKSESGKNLNGAEFALTRAMKDGNGKWVYRVFERDGVPVQSATRRGATSQGLLSFDNLTEGHYILEETAAPAGYIISDPSKWLLTLTKVDAANKIILVPSIVPLNEDGSVVPGAEAETLTVENDTSFQYEVLNSKTPRGDLEVTKKWLHADGTSEYTAEELAELDAAQDTTVSGELWRTATEETVVINPNVRIYAKLDTEPDSSYVLRWEGPVKSGSDISYAFAVNGTAWAKQWHTSTGAVPITGSDRNITYDNGINKPSGHVYILQNIEEDVDIFVEMDHEKVNDQGIGFYLVSKVDPEESSETHTIDEKVGDFTLSITNGWTVTWTSEQLNEDDYDYTYYFKNVTESPASLDGFTFVDTPVVTTDPTTGKVSYAFRNISEGEKTDLTVRKAWMDGDENHSNESISYKIQRADYDVNGVPKTEEYDYIETGKTEAEIYTLSSSDVYNGVAWQKHHDNLPADNGKSESDPNYRTYKYFVVEVNAPQGYTASYSDITAGSGDNQYAIKLITNTPSDNALTIDKKWMDYDQSTALTEDLPSEAYITGTLVRDDTSGATVNVYFRNRIDDRISAAELHASYSDIVPGSEFSLWAVDSNGVAPIYGVTANGVPLEQNGEEKTFGDYTTKAFTVTVDGATNIYCDWYFNVDYQSGVYYDVSYAHSEGEQQVVTETVGDFRLDATHGWRYIWTSDKLDEESGKTYNYRITNVKEHKADGTVVEHYDGFLEPITGSFVQGADGRWSTSIINVKEPPLTSIKLKKQVTINDFDPANSMVEDKTVADGTYVIHMDGAHGTATEGKSYTIKITISEGVATAATVRDNASDEPADVPVDLTDGVLEIPDIYSGTYILTEDEDSKTVLTAVNSTGQTTTTDLDNRKITVILDDNESEIQLVSFINNYADNGETDIAHVSVRKTFKGLTLNTLPADFKVNTKITATIDGVQRILEYELGAASDPTNGIIWNRSVDVNGDIVYDWKIAIRGLNPDAHVEVEEVNYAKPGYDVTPTANPDDGDGTSYSGTVSSSTVVQSVASVITNKNSRVFPLSDLQSTATIFIARVVPEQTALIISKNKLNLSERAAIEAQLHNMPNAGDWYNNTPPQYYSFEDAANHKIFVRNRSEVTYSETTEGDPSTGQITFDKKCQWDMVATVTMTYVEGRPADFNFTNSYTEHSTGIDIVKVDQNNRTKKLPGAKFTLTKLDESSTPSHIKYKKIDGTETLERQEESSATDGNGSTSFSGLTSGYYEIKETQLPAGYVLTGDGCFYIKVAEGVATYLEISTDPNKPIIEWDTIEQTSSEDLIQVTAGSVDDPSTPDDETTPTLFSVGNEPGPILPHTGGIGTTIFYILGSILVIGGGVYFVSRRRMK